MRKLLIALVALVALVGAAWWWSNAAAPPVEYVVVQGDTLSKIAKRFEVEVDELRAWNGIEGDLIEVDQVLLIHLEAAPEGELAPKPAPARRGGKRAPRKTLRVAEEPPAGGAMAGPLDGLNMPAPEACVPFDPELGDEGMAAMVGLGYPEIKGALDGVIQRALACPRGEASGVWTPVFELEVGCDGVVSEVRVSERGGAPALWSACAAEVLKRADFPAHDMPDGFPVTYPVTVEY